MCIRDSPMPNTELGSLIPPKTAPAQRWALLQLLWGGVLSLWGTFGRFQPQAESAWRRLKAPRAANKSG
eukprot:5651859-Alexandrium_andersonii.AAC.1